MRTPTCQEDKRLELQEMLEHILGFDHVYFQPPPSIKMEYPAIVFSRTRIRNTFADNRVYMQNKAYEITVIDKRPNSEITDRVSMLPCCQFDRHFKADNLNHDVFTLYF